MNFVPRTSLRWALESRVVGGVKKKKSKYERKYKEMKGDWILFVLYLKCILSIPILQLI